MNPSKAVKLSLVIILAGGLFSASAAEVKEIWQKDCAKCHGPDGKGDTKMGKKLEIKDLTDAKVQASLKDEEMFKAIKEGVKDGEKTKMKAAEGVNDEDIKALVAYVRKFKK
jgi:mono/diheme cytochrome c family protein